MITASRAYALIARHYGSRTTRRSAVPLIRHIDEGLAILARLDAPMTAREAFCIHPLLQSDVDFVMNGALLDRLDARVGVLAIEYRKVANAALSTRALASPTDIELSPLAEVNTMLIADKVQNRHDFLLHHRATHPRADALDRYFLLWLARLGVDDARYAELVAGLGVHAAPVRGTTGE